MYFFMRKYFYFLLYFCITIYTLILLKFVFFNKSFLQTILTSPGIENAQFALSDSKLGRAV